MITNNFAATKTLAIALCVASLILAISNMALAGTLPATVTLKSGAAWIEPFNGGNKKDLSQNVVTPVHPEDVVVCGPSGKLIVDLGLGAFELVKPCTFRIPLTKPVSSPKQEQMAEATTTAGRSRSGIVKWHSPQNGSVLSPKGLTLAWTPAAYMGPATITVSLGRSHPIWEQDDVDTKVGTLDAPLLRELLTFESRSGYRGPFLITIDCGKSGVAESVFYVRNGR